MAKNTLTDEMILAQIPSARARGEAEGGPMARRVRYDSKSGRILVELDNGCLLGFPAELAQGLRGSEPEDLADVKVAMGGAALRWERLDADLLVAGLVRGAFGSRSWMREIARELGKSGGRARTEAKVAASRRNGRKGGRPRKR